MLLSISPWHNKCEFLIKKYVKVNFQNFSFQTTVYQQWILLLALMLLAIECTACILKSTSNYGIDLKMSIQASNFRANVLQSIVLLPSQLWQWSTTDQNISYWSDLVYVLQKHSLAKNLKIVIHFIFMT